MAKFRLENFSEFCSSQLIEEKGTDLSESVFLKKCVLLNSTQ